MNLSNIKLWFLQPAPSTRICQAKPYRKRKNRIKVLPLILSFDCNSRKIKCWLDFNLRCTAFGWYFNLPGSFTGKYETNRTKFNYRCDDNDSVMHLKTICTQKKWFRTKVNRRNEFIELSPNAPFPLAYELLLITMAIITSWNQSRLLSMRFPPAIRDQLIELVIAIDDDIVMSNRSSHCAFLCISAQGKWSVFASWNWGFRCFDSFLPKCVLVYLLLCVI